MKKKPEEADFNGLKNEVRQGKAARLYVLTGEEDFLADNLIAAILSAVLRPGFEAVDCVRLDGSSRTGRPDIDRLEREASTPAFASVRRVVVVRNSGLFAGKPAKATRENDAVEEGDESKDEPVRKEGKDQSARLIRLMETLSDGICLIFREEKVDRRQRSLVEAVQKHGVLAVFERQKPPELVSWLAGICKKEGVAIDRKAAESLVERCESSMRLIRTESVKLLLYCASVDQKTIDLDLVDALCVQDIRGGIFDLTDAIAAGRFDKAVQLLESLLFRKEPTTLIRFLLARHVRNLLIALGARSDAELASMAGVPPFVASRLRTQARGLSPVALEDLYIRCQENDWSVKSGRMPDVSALETLIVAACELFRRRALT